MKLFKICIVLAAAGVLLLGCGDDDEGEDVLLQGISITSSYAKVPADITMQYTASGAYSDGSTADITNSVSWSSSVTAVATIDNTGLLTSIATGETNINATASGITSNTKPLSVEVITIDHLTVVPDALILSLGTSENLQAFAVASNSESYDITTNVAWSSADTAIATIDANGLVAAISAGGSTMTADFRGFFATSAVTVQAVSASDIRIEPANSHTVPDFLVQFKAFDVSTGADITNDVTWSSDDITIADIGKNDGLAETGDVGAAVITATAPGSTTASTALTVDDAELLSIEITDPNSGRLPVGFSFSYTATGNYSNGFRPDMTKLVDWKADDDDIADFKDGTGGIWAGVVDAFTPGSTEVKATYGTLLGDIEDITILTVTIDNLVSIALTPLNTTVTLGDTFLYTPIGTFASGETLDLNQSVATKWNPVDPAIVIVDGQGSHDSAPGTAYAIGVGTTTVTVQYLSIESPSASVMVQ
jgi:hypothetical protein